MVVSHDRWFLDRICTHILSFEGDGNVVFYEGSYSDYEEFKKAHNDGKEPPAPPLPQAHGLIPSLQPPIYIISPAPHYRI